MFAVSFDLKGYRFSVKGRLGTVNERSAQPRYRRNVGAAEIDSDTIVSQRSFFSMENGEGHALLSKLLYHAPLHSAMENGIMIWKIVQFIRYFQERRHFFCLPHHPLPHYCGICIPLRACGYPSTIPNSTSWRPVPKAYRAFAKCFRRIPRHAFIAFSPTAMPSSEYVIPARSFSINAASVFGKPLVRSIAVVFW